jgi:curved DNA-binding protein CbpA
MAEESYYELLQVTPTADLEIITGAYRTLIRRHHPDRNPSPNADATTKLLNEAWEVLSDPTRRADYDRGLGAQTNRPDPPRRPPNQPAQEAPPPRPKQPPPRSRASQREPNVTDWLRWVFVGLVAVTGIGSVAIAIVLILLDL